MGTFVMFGEALLRLSPPGHKRLGHPGDYFEMGPAGAELNVACSLALLGDDVRYVTTVPSDNPLAEMLIARVQSYGVDTQYIQRTEGRLGLVFVETGASQRPSRVHYDREHSSISLATPTQYNWSEIFDSANHLHLTGITPALSKSAAESTLSAAKLAKEAGLRVSCDLNFRSKLWQWEDAKSARELAREVMWEILPYVDLLIANETDLGDVLGFRSEFSEGNLKFDLYAGLARQAVEAFSNLTHVAITLRESLSASHNRWGGLLLDSVADQIYFAPEQNGSYHPYNLDTIVDRVGAGDAFAAGLLHALSAEKHQSPQQAIAFAVAASCLAHSVPGDINHSNLGEIEALLGGNTAGRVLR